MTREDIIRTGRGSEMTEAQYWRQRCEVLMANFTDAVRSAIDAQSTPRMLADAESYNLGKLHGAIEEREACAKVCDEDIEKWKSQASVEQVAAAIRARGQTVAGFAVVIDESIPADTFKVVGAKQE